MNDTFQQIAIELKRQKRTERFPDHVCAQANRVMCSAGSVCENANIIKYSNDQEAHLNIPYLKNSLIATAAACIRMIEELEKETKK